MTRLIGKIVNKLTLIKSLLFTLCLITISPTQAVYVNDEGTGEVLIYPYYTVNNNQNTFYTIINTTADTKAVKVRFREGENGAEVMDFNVYLSGFDVWTGILSPGIASGFGHDGEPNVLHATNDTSCAPFLDKTGQQFLPFIIDQDPGNSNLLRAREGYIVVMEMSTFNGATVVAADHNPSGIPASCNSIEADWEDGLYDTNADEAAPTGGILGHATLLDVANGSAINFDALALDYFWQSEGDHTEPGDLSVTLGNASPESLRMVNGTMLKSDWSSGIDAVSAALMQHKLFNEYELYTIVSANTEWIVTFPTKHSLVNNSIDPQPPFSQNWDGNQACEIAWVSSWDSNEVNDPTVEINLCYSANVLEFLLPGSPTVSTSGMLGSFNSTPINTSSQSIAAENGWAELSFQSANQSIITDNEVRYDGLPVSGFAVKRFTNAGAGPGLLAVYASSASHKTQPKITFTDLIFMDGFDDN